MHLVFYVGNDSAATTYLKGVTWQPLTNAFKTVIDNALEKTGASKYWAAVFEAYNKIPVTKKVILTCKLCY